MDLWKIETQNIPRTYNLLVEIQIKAHNCVATVPISFYETHIEFQTENDRSPGIEPMRRPVGTPLQSR